mgnify:CR=1 FL=1
MSVSKPLPHDAAKLHVTGQARYVDDVPMPAGTLHLAFGVSSIARGTFTAINLDAVRAAKGVRAVLVAQDLPFVNDVSPSVHDEPMLSDGPIHYCGQPIFLVVADTHLNARHAARLGDITYDAQTPILTIEDALAADARFEDGPRIYTKGDVDMALATAPNRLQGRLDMGGQEHFYLEGQAALALPQEGGDMVVQSSTQHPTEIQHKVADALGVAMHAVRVEIRRMGGGFGGKESQGNLPAMTAALAAYLTGHPAKTIYDRDDDFMLTGKRHDCRIDYHVGFDDDGRVLVVEFEQALRCGMSWDLSAGIAARAMCHADNAYDISHMKITNYCCLTHTQSNTAFRGFGGPQGMLGIERVMDEVAHYLGLDPLEVRRKNFYPDKKAGKFGITPYGQPVEDCVIQPIVDELVKTSDYVARRSAIAAFNAANQYVKRGIALTPVKFGISFNTTFLNQAGSLIHVYNDGSVHLNHGGTEMGQGLYTKVAQIVAHEFQIDVDLVKITATTTGKVPNTSATAASSGTDLNGMAAMRAAQTIKGRIAAFLADEYQTDQAEVVFANGQVHIGTDSMAFADAVKRAYLGRVSLSATGFYATPKLSWDKDRMHGRPFYYFAYGAAVSEVIVDLLTGENRLLRADLLHDVGKSINPAIDMGQIEGGFLQGVGWLTTEELVWDQKGRLRTHAPSTYKIPACSDRPDIFNVDLWDGENPADTISKSKAVGEPPLMLGVSAFFALSDAISACGPNFADLQAPATPEEVLAAIGRTQDV